MKNKEFEDYKLKIKENINDLINQGSLEEAKKLIDEYEEIIKQDLEIYSMKAVICIMENNFEDAELILKNGLEIDTNNFDLTYNLAYLYEQTGELEKAIEFYIRAEKHCNDYNIKQGINESINSIKSSLDEILYKIEVKENNIDRIMNDIIECLENMLDKKEYIYIKDLTLIIPTYNRADILKNDLENGFKLGNTKKLIIDDNSNEVDKKMLRNLMEQDKYNIDKIIFHDKNDGIAISSQDGIKNIRTKYAMFCDDDDIIVCNNHKSFTNNLKLIPNNYKFIIPRYIINMNSSNELSSGYDRNGFSDVSSGEVLIKMLLTGEMDALRAGAVFNNYNLNSASPDSIFKVSEDYVMMSRVLAKNIKKKIKVSEDYAYIRRVSNMTLSRQINKNKISLNLLAMLISGYYCLKENLISQQQVINSITKRGKLLQDKYNHGNEFSDIIIKYLYKSISLEEFINITRDNDFISDISIENIPSEIKAIMNYIK